MTRRGHAPLARRRAWVFVHRWLGLATAAFLVVLGATGSLIAYNDALEEALSPRLFRVVPPFSGAPFLDPFALRERVLESHPGATVDWVDLSPAPERSVSFGLEPAPGSSTRLPNDQVFVDPYTAQVLGERSEGDLSQGWKNVMPFVYRLHTLLALGDAGTLVLGVVALLWTIDCFVGSYLTLPARRESRTTRPASSRRPFGVWVAQWQPAWAVRWRASTARALFDLHRAGGLWAWGLLFVLAWSGVGFNLAPVYEPTMRALTGYAPRSVPEGRVEAGQPTPIDWAEARRLAAAAMREAAAAHGFEVRRERLIHLDRARHRYEYRVLSSLDVGDRGGNTTLFLDASTGAVLGLALPTSQRAGNTIDTWLSALHTAGWGGAPMQLALCGAGIAVVMLSATGVWIWWRRAKARRFRPPRRASPLRTGS